MAHHTDQPLAAHFDAAQHALGDLAYQLLGAITAALGAMYPDAAYISTFGDSLDDSLSLRAAFDEHSTSVHEFDGSRLPAIPARLAAPFGLYDHRDQVQIELLLNAAMDAGADLPRLPDDVLVDAGAAALCLIVPKA